MRPTRAALKAKPSWFGAICSGPAITGAATPIARRSNPSSSATRPHSTMTLICNVPRGHRSISSVTSMCFKMSRRLGRGAPPHIRACAFRVMWTGYQGRAGARPYCATRTSAHFQRHPPGRDQLAVFPHCSLDPYESRYGRSIAGPARTALKNRQPTCGDVFIICEMVQ